MAATSVIVSMALKITAPSDCRSRKFARSCTCMKRSRCRRITTLLVTNARHTFARCRVTVQKNARQGAGPQRALVQLPGRTGVFLRKIGFHRIPAGTGLNSSQLKIKCPTIQAVPPFTRPPIFPWVEGGTWLLPPTAGSGFVGAVVRVPSQPIASDNAQDFVRGRIFPLP